jgi:predicted ATPase with chaperone activity
MPGGSQQLWAGVAHLAVTINLSPATLPKAGSHYDLSNVHAVPVDLSMATP